MTIIEADVVGWWDFEEGTGTNIDDSTDTNDGTAVGSPTWVTGGPTNLENGLSFAGAGNNQKVDFAFNPNQEPGTACVWAIVDDTTGSPFEVIFGEGNGGGGGGMDIFVEGDALKGRVRMGGADRTVEWTTASGFASATLYFITFTWKDGTSAELELFTGTTSRDTLSGNLGTQDGGTVELAAGSNDALSREFGGDIFQCILFDRVLTSAEISDLYNNGDGTTYDQLFAAATRRVFNVT